jgi:hypothetical protein
MTIKKATNDNAKGVVNKVVAAFVGSRLLG